MRRILLALMLSACASAQPVVVPTGLSPASVPAPGAPVLIGSGGGGGGGGGGSAFAPVVPSGMGGLNIPTSRLATWTEAANARANYQASLTYSRYDVTCTGVGCGVGGIDGWHQAPGLSGGAGCSSVTTATPNEVNCMVLNGTWTSANPVRLVFPAGNYVFDANTDVTRLRRSWTVFELVSGANFNVSHNGQSGINLGDCLNDGSGTDESNAGASAISVCRNPNRGAPVTWNGPWAKGDTVMLLGDTSGFAVGEYAQMRVGQAGCSLLPNPTGGASGIWWVDKVAAISTNVSVTLTRGLPYDLPSNCRASPTIRWFTPLVGAGIDGGVITFTGATKQDSEFNSAIAFNGIVDSWVRGVTVANFDNQAMTLALAQDNRIGESLFDDITHYVAFNTTNVNFLEGASHNVYENNRCTRSAVCVQARNSSFGNVVAYSYMLQAGSAFPERSIFSHGVYAAAMLSEGNDADRKMLMSDGSTWAFQGPKNTAYRNRLRSTGLAGNFEIGDGAGSIGWSDPTIGNNKSFTASSSTINTATDTITVVAHGFADDEYVGWTSDDPITGLTQGQNYYVMLVDADNFQLSDTVGGAAKNISGTITTGGAYVRSNASTAHGPFNVVANHVDCMAHAAGSCAAGAPVNRATTDMWIERNVVKTTLRSETRTTTSWGATMGEAPPGNNVVSAGPITGVTAPWTLYRTRSCIPKFWCKEACPVDYDGIGAFYATGQGACKLPAQITYEAGTCTPYTVGEGACVN